MKKLSYLTITFSLAILTGCGGGGSGDSSSASQGNSANGNNELKCDRGILINSNLTAKSIFDEHLYILNYLNIEDKSSGHTEIKKTGIYGEEIENNGQMLYSNYTPIYNLSLEEIESNTKTRPKDYTLNSSGLSTTSFYQKQNNGWPFGYLIASDNLKLSLASFNDNCNFTTNKIDYSFEAIDVSGKKLKDILPSNILTNSPKPNDYIYIDRQIGNILKRNEEALNKLLNSDISFPQGAIIYVPKSAIYSETQFTFSKDDQTQFLTLDEWFDNVYGKTSYKYKKDKIGSLNVIYSVDSNNNAVFSFGADPAIEKDGKIYDGEWYIKGDVLSSNYGIPSKDGFDNNDSSGEHTLFNKVSYNFISTEIQKYYK